MYEVIVVGGGPAGLSAATILGRCRRQVLVCDDGHYRNQAARALHGFLSRDGIHPAELLRIGREQLARYDVEYREAHVAAAVCTPQGFELTLADGARLGCRMLLLATGVVDRIPETEGFERLFGAGVFHCPYCDGWEVRDQRLVAYGRGRNGAGLAAELKAWSGDVRLCTDGPGNLSQADRTLLDGLGIAVHERKIARLEGAEHLDQIVFRDGSTLPCRAIFLSTGQYQRSELAASLGCAFTRKGAVRTGKMEGTGVPGLYVVGDASKNVQFAVVAAAEGARAGLAINRALTHKISG